MDIQSLNQRYDFLNIIGVTESQTFALLLLNHTKNPNMCFLCTGNHCVTGEGQKVPKELVG